MDTLIAWLDSLIASINQLAPADTFFTYGFNLRAFVAIIMVSVICGAIGSQVVGNRMSFFSDALAHCAFAGLAVAFLLFLALGLAQAHLLNWMMLNMVVFGVGIGLLIAFVHDMTGLASDTVIGVFFAGAIGLGAVFARMIRNPVFNIESFIFGAPDKVRTIDLISLLLLLLVTVVFFVG